MMLTFIMKTYFNEILDITPVVYHYLSFLALRWSRNHSPPHFSHSVDEELSIIIIIIKDNDMNILQDE